MKFYSVYKKPKDLLDKCILVKTGFSWRNFFFGIFWASYKKIWDLILMYLLLILTAKLAILFYPEFTVHIITISVSLHIILSFYANNLLGLKLISKGYKKVDFVAGDTEELALLRFFGDSKKS